MMLPMTSCVDQRLMDDMVQLDRAYIPTVYYLKKGDMPKAKLAYAALVKEWQNLNTGYRKAYLEEDWTTTLDLVDGHFKKSGKAFLENDDYWALCHLENARFEWTDLRRRYDMKYYVDYLYEFQMAWEVVTETINDPVLCWLQWNEFERQVKDAEMAWKDLMAKPLEENLIKFSKEEKQKFIKLREDANETWKAFKKEMDCADREKIALTANEMTIQFDQFMNHFGNFGPTITYVAML